MTPTERIAAIRQKLEQIVITEGCDRGVVLLSVESPTHYDPSLKCQVYELENFSPLGDALIELYELTSDSELRKSTEQNSAASQ